MVVGKAMSGKKKDGSGHHSKTTNEVFINHQAAYITLRHTNLSITNHSQSNILLYFIRHSSNTIQVLSLVSLPDAKEYSF